MNSKSKKVYCFSLPKRKKPYRKSIHIYKKVLDKTLPGEIKKTSSRIWMKSFKTTSCLHKQND